MHDPSNNDENRDHFVSTPPPITGSADADVVVGVLVAEGGQPEDTRDEDPSDVALSAAELKEKGIQINWRPLTQAAMCTALEIAGVSRNGKVQLPQELFDYLRDEAVERGIQIAASETLEICNRYVTWREAEIENTEAEEKESLDRRKVIETIRDEMVDADAPSVCICTRCGTEFQALSRNLLEKVDDVLVVRLFRDGPLKGEPIRQGQFLIHKDDGRLFVEGYCLDCLGLARDAAQSRGQNPTSFVHSIARDIVSRYNEKADRLRDWEATHAPTQPKGPPPEYVARKRKKQEKDQAFSAKLKAGVKQYPQEGKGNFKKK